jgi:predicted Zn-dependent peptidase
LNYARTTLTNGVPVLSRTATTYGARLRVTFLAGSSQEEAGEEGLAHLAEHMPFKGSQTRDASTIAREIERRGGEIDAFTDHHETSYLAIGPGESFADVFAILADILRHPRLDGQDLERERTVILEEVRSYEDEPSSIAYQLAIGHLWRGSPLARPVAGSRDSVKQLTVEQVARWYARHYGANRLAIAAAGSVEHAEVVELAEQHFGSLPRVAAPTTFLPSPASAGPHASLQRRESEQVALCLALPAPAETDPRLPVLEALAMVLGGNDCSRLFSRLRDELGLVYGIDAALEVGPTASQIVVSTECVPGSLVTVLDEIERSLNRLIDEPVASDELADALMVVRARWLLPFDLPTSYADWLLARELWHGNVTSPHAYVDRFAAVTPEAVQAMARECLAPARRCLGLVGPLARTWRPTGWAVESSERPRRRHSR